MRANETSVVGEGDHETFFFFQAEEGSDNE
jgi:hypothetical protein